MIVLSVMYPWSEGAAFDWDYYMAKHAPLVRDAFAATGLHDMQVLRALPTPDGTSPLYVCIANIIFDSVEALQASLGGPRAAEVLSDVTNFTTIQPVRQISAAA